MLSPEPGPAAQADAAAVPQPRQLRRLGRRAVALAGREGRGGGRLHPHRDRGLAAARRGRRRARHPLGRQGPRQGRQAAGQLRARLRRHRPGHRAGRGHLGPPHRRRDPRVRPRRRPRAPGVGARGQGGLEGPEEARPRDPHARLAAALRRQAQGVRRLVDLPDGRRPRVDRLRRRPRLHRRHRLGPRPPAAVQDAPSSCAGSSRAASASPGAPRRSPRAATGRCPSSRRRAWSSPATRAGWSTCPVLKGIHYAIHAGILAAEQIFAELKAGSTRLQRLRAGRRGVAHRHRSSTSRAT